MTLAVSRMRGSSGLRNQTHQPPGRRTDQMAARRVSSEAVTFLTEHFVEKLDPPAPVCFGAMRT